MPAAPARPDWTGPAAQLGAAFIALPPAAAGAAQTLVIRLDPLELGRVQIRVERSQDGPARVVLSVERTDTLMLLLQDRPRLDQALDQAGVPAAGRIVEFSLASPQASDTAPRPGGPDPNQASGPYNGQSGQSGSEPGSPWNNPGSNSGSNSGGNPGSNPGSGQSGGRSPDRGGWDQAPRRQELTAAAWVRAGIDITA
jgi:hypothetical protein